MNTTINTSGVQCPNPECHAVHKLDDLSIDLIVNDTLINNKDRWTRTRCPSCNKSFDLKTELHLRYHARST